MDTEVSKPALPAGLGLVKSEANFVPDFEGFVDQCIDYPQSRLIA